MADNGNNSSDDANERPQDWEMLSLSLSSLTDSKPSGDATSSDDAEAGAGPSSTGSCPEEPQGIPDDQVHSNYYELQSSSFSKNSEDEKSALPTLERGETNASVGGSGFVVGKDSVESSPIVEGDIPGEVPEIYSCLDNEEAECLAGIERDILAEPEHTHSETFEEAYTELRAEDISSSSKNLIPEISSKSKSKKTWWKQQVEHVSQASALWSLALAAAVMGLVILGQRWQHERLHNQQLRLQLGSKDEKINQLIFQISRLKDVVSGRRRVPVIRS